MVRGEMVKYQDGECWWGLIKVVSQEYFFGEDAMVYY